MLIDDIPEKCGSKFVKIDTEPVYLQFPPCEIERQVLHFGGGGKPSECSGDDCRRCARGDDPAKARYKMTVTEHPSGAEKICDLSEPAIQALKNVKKQMTDEQFRSTIFAAVRTGMGKSTRYQFTVHKGAVVARVPDPLPF